MAVDASHAALPYPIKNARFSFLVPYLDADGDPTLPTTPDTEISKDNGSATDCVEEVSTTTSMDGMALLTLTGAETNCSTIAINAKVASGPKATLGTFYPRVLPVLYSGTASAGAAGSLTLASDVLAIADLLIGCILKTTGGTGGGGTGGANNQARVITGFNSSRVATVSPNWETTPDNTTTYEVLITEFSLIRLSDVIAFGRVAATSASGRPEVNTSHAAGTAWNSGAIGASTLAADTITAAKIAADAIGASELATDAVQEIRNAITGGAYALDTDANGRIRIVDGTGTGEINTNAGAIALVDLVTSMTNDTSGVTTLLARLTNTRATNLDNLDATISSRSSHSAAAVWAVGTRTLTALGFTLAAADLAANIITAAKVAADAIGASQLASDAATEIATAVWASGTRNLTALGFTLAAADLASNIITAAKIAADAIGASQLATDAVQEIRNAITGGAYALDTDANGAIRIVDGTGARELNTSSGSIDTVVNLTNAPTNGDLTTTMKASVKTQVDQGILDAALVTFLQGIQKVVEADERVDKATTPWELVMIERGTGAIGVGTELLRKKLKDVDGGNILDTVTVIGQAHQ